MMLYFEIFAGTSNKKLAEGVPHMLNTNCLILNDEAKRLAYIANKKFGFDTVTVVIGENHFTYHNELYRRTFTFALK